MDQELLEAAKFCPFLKDTCQTDCALFYSDSKGNHCSLAKYARNSKDLEELNKVLKGHVQEKKE